MNNKDWVRTELIRIKTEHGCVVCRESHPACLDFHHKDPAGKAFAISAYFRRRQYRFSDLVAELAKCEVLCSNCHRRRHYGE